MPEETAKLAYISTISIDNLLIFYAIGVALLVFAIQAKISLASRRDRNSQLLLARHAGIYRFIKTAFNWGVFYLISALLSLFSSMVPINSNFLRPLLYNISFILSLIVTLYLILSYFILVIIELLSNWMIARRFDL